MTFEFQGRNRLGAEQDGRVVDLNRGYALLLATRGVVDFQGQADRELPPDMREGIARSAVLRDTKKVFPLILRLLRETPVAAI